MISRFYNLTIMSKFFKIFVCVHFCEGLTCYSCNTNEASPDCIDNPGKYTTVQCGKDEEGNLKDYCYTYRIEENNPETGELGIYLRIEQHWRSFVYY